MNKDVFLSILAMDTYNRGYNQGVAGLADGGRIGAARITRQSNSLAGSNEVNTGFYAIAYEYEGDTVISYRGSDSGRVQDIFLGYPTALAFPAWVQSSLAVSFARSVMGYEDDVRSESLLQTTVITGHSLDGGLTSSTFTTGHRCWEYLACPANDNFLSRIAA